MEDFRLKYPLKPTAVVVDAGAFHGDFTAWCRERFRCKVLAFEPLFYSHVAARFKNDPMVSVLPYGLGDRDCKLPISVRGDSSSVYFDQTTDVETVHLRDVVDVFSELALVEVGLFKINIEGGEYPLMTRILDAGLAPCVWYFQIQYHGQGAGPEGPAAARDRIREQLSATHDEEWCVNGGQWESWALR